MRVAYLSVVVLVIGGCATEGMTTLKQVMQIEPGMSRAQVVALLGEPGRRTFKNNAEALQYCRTGFSEDEYTTIWLANGKVSALTEDRAALVTGNCAGAYPIIDWGQAPPDVRIAIE